MKDLDAACPTCSEPYGDHTLRKLNECLDTPTTDLPFEPVPDDAAALASENLRQKLGLDPNVIVADDVIVKSMKLGFGPVTIGGVLHEFGMNLPGRVEPVATVLFVGGKKIMHGYGKLQRDSANAVVKALGGISL